MIWRPFLDITFEISMDMDMVWWSLWIPGSLYGSPDLGSYECCSSLFSPQKMKGKVQQVFKLL